MLIQFDSTETVTGQYIHPNIVREWLLANGWKPSDDFILTDYWKVWYRSQLHRYWVHTPNLPGTYADQLDRSDLTRWQGELLVTLQEYHIRPAKTIWREMMKLQEKKVNDVR